MVSLAENERVGILTAREQVFTCLAVQPVATGTALQRVIATAAMDQKAAPRSKRIASHDLIERPRHAKTDAAEPEPGNVPVAIGRAEDPWVVEPGTATQHTPTTVPAARPRRAIARSPSIVLMPAVLDPLPHVAVHVVQTPRGRVERPHRRGLGVVPPAAAPAQFARLRPMSWPQLYRVSVPARAAYSHSDSLGSRYAAPVS